MTATTQTQPQPFTAVQAIGRPSRGVTVALWVVTVATAGMFILAGTSKLAGAAVMVQMFDRVGLGQWFRYLTGSIEVGSAIALLVPSLALYAALALGATMIGAVLTHLFIVGGSPAPAVILLIASSFIAWTRWSRR